MLPSSYTAAKAYDELFTPSLRARPGLSDLARYLRRTSPKDLAARQADATLAVRSMGITFTVYSEGANIDRDWPFDIIPRPILKAEWQRIEKGLTQRLAALNHFIGDIYNERRIIKDKRLPASLIRGSPNYLACCEGMKPAHGVWAHVCGSDLIRDTDGTIYVLEDNLRVPSGVAYMMENRNISKRVLPGLFEKHRILPIDDYPTRLLDTLASISPRRAGHPEVAVLTPGIYNSAYFEHAFLAQQMGADLVEGPDLIVDADDCVQMKTVEGLRRVDVLYRRLDDAFLDPEAFNKDSLLGVPGLIRAWRKGRVALANAPGAGVADDKAVYTAVPEMIRYYLGEEPILPNVPSYRCADKKERQHALANLERLVVKPVNASGGYGLYIGPRETSRRQAQMRRLIKAQPQNYIAQPIVTLSTAPTLVGASIAPRHVDLRPFILQGRGSYVSAGGLTRVALPKGSLVVNSSQGGGSKDTWVIDAPAKGSR